MKSIAFERLDGWVFLVHGRMAPLADEWDAYMAHLAPDFDRIRGILVVTEDAGPNSAQRARMNVMVEKRAHPVATAVLTSSVIARGIVTALSWFNPTIRAFAPEELRAAIVHLGMSDVRVDEVRRRVAALRKGLEGDREA